jgi:hypothetical protein
MDVDFMPEVILISVSPDSSDERIKSRARKLDIN